MFFSIKKIKLELIFYIIPSLGSLINLIIFLIIPTVTDFGEFEIFVKNNVIAGLYLAIVAQGAHNITAISLENKEDKSLLTYQLISFFTCILTLIYSLITLNFLVFFLVAAYLVQQQITVIVTFLRKQYDGVRTKLYLLLQPCLLLINLCALSIFNVDNFWIISYCAASVMTVMIIILDSKFPLNLHKHLYNKLKKKDLVNVATMLFSSSAISIFIHFDYIFLKNPTELSQFVILSKFLYSIPMSLCSLIIYRDFRDKKSVWSIKNFITNLGIGIFSFILLKIYINFIGISLNTSGIYLLSFSILFTNFNFLVSFENLKNPLFTFKVTTLLVISLILLSQIYTNPQLNTVIEIKVILMFAVIFVLLIKEKRSER